jgi:hypothetical protein
MTALATFLCLAALAASAPFWPGLDNASSTQAVVLSSPADTWPAELISPTWTPLALGPREARFARDFPGRIAAFATPDGRTLLVRRLHRPTRKLHPAADCLRAVGYAIEPRPIHRESNGVEWSELHATRDNDTLRVRERLLGADGRRWTDISAWYWSAALGRATGPWWAVTEFAAD